jgi:hypothetical protein
MANHHLEPRRNITYETGARNEFVRAVKRHLPQEALEQLVALPADQLVQEWATRWRVNAPCVVEEATSWRDLGRSYGLRRLILSDGYTGFDPLLLRDWRAALRELNALPVESTWLENPLALFRPDCIKGARANALNANGSLKPLQDMESLSRTFSEQVFANESVLAPIAADPSRESRVDFIGRCQCHWDARVARAHGLGFTRTSPRPSLRQHAEWLARYQVQLESYGTLARSARADLQTVREAVRRTADLVALPLRPAQKGGRPRQKP